MISERAKTGLTQLMSRCLEDSLRNGAFPQWSLEPLADEEAITGQQFIMLTLSSYDFRMLLLLHFTRDDATQRYVADSLQMPVTALEEARFYDYLAEVGNTFCGAFKRELGMYVPHLGMSTPNLLVTESRAYVRTWPIDHAVHLKAHADGAAAFFGSLYVSAGGDLDFQPTQSAGPVEEVETGALELF